MKVRTKAEFFQALAKSKLLSASERVKAREATRGISEPDAVARLLVESGRLTRWQGGQLLSGRTKLYLGKYKLLKICGRGGMGVVFKAEQPSVNRPVAIKVLHKALLSKPRAVARFQREMKLAGLLNHPNIVTAYDADKLNDSYFLVMEYVAGKSLKYYSQKHGRLPIAWSVECVRQAAIGLVHVHEVGLVHRDVKPSNILVVNDSFTKSPRIKILDVGLSRFVSEGEHVDAELTNAGQILGTMDYMAPEQVKDARSADIRADIFGLGATLYQLLTGSAPLVGKSLMQTYLARMGQDVPAVSKVRPEVPAALDGILAKMLHRDPQKRFQVPSEVVDALDAYIAGDPNLEATLAAESIAVPKRIHIDSSVDLEAESSTHSIGGDSDSSYLEFLEQMSMDQTLDEAAELSTDTSVAGHFERLKSSTRDKGLYGAARRWLHTWLEWRARRKEAAEAARAVQQAAERDLKEQERLRAQKRKRNASSAKRSGSAESGSSLSHK
ncbi:MAG: serine/threonine protein kinase [Planctomycetaceae bacterium]